MVKGGAEPSWINVGKGIAVDENFAYASAHSNFNTFHAVVHECA